MKIWIENYNEAKRFEPKGQTIAIRVFDPGARTHELEESIWEEDYPGDRWDNCPQAPFPAEKYVAVLGYTFSDINMDHPFSEGIRKTLIRDCGTKLFNANLAEHLVRGFRAHYKQADSLIVHCHAGMSRSPAIACALADTFGFLPEWQGRATKLLEDRDFVGNRFVYRLVCEAADRLGV